MFKSKVQHLLCSCPILNLITPVSFDLNTSNPVLLISSGLEPEVTTDVLLMLLLDFKDEVNLKKVKNDLILNMKPENRSMTFHNW